MKLRILRFPAIIKSPPFLGEILRPFFKIPSGTVTEKLLILSLLAGYQGSLFDEITPRVSKSMKVMES